jgi:peroxiredoxin
MKKMFLAVLMLFVVAFNVHAQVENGAAAPDFTLTDTNGKKHNLSDFKGKLVVLEWLNPDCPFVVKHYGPGNMQGLQKRYTDQGVIWLSINSSAEGKEGYYSAEALNEWANKSGVKTTAILLDSDGKVGKRFGAKTTPHMFIIDASGNVVYQGAIDSVASTDDADIKDATNYVSTTLDEIMAGKTVSTPSTKSYGCSVKY